MVYKLIGREAESSALENILDTLGREAAEQTIKQTSTGVVIVGRGGMGKTLLLRSFAEQVNRQGSQHEKIKAGDPICIILDFQSSDVQVKQSVMNIIADAIQSRLKETDGAFSEFYSKLVALLIAQRDLRSSAVIEERKADIEVTFFDTLRELALVYRIVILMDTLEKLEKRQKSDEKGVKTELIAFLGELFLTPNMMFVLAGRDATYTSAVKEEYRWYRDAAAFPVPAYFQTWNLQPLEKPEVARELVMNLLSGDGDDLTASDSTPDPYEVLSGDEMRVLDDQLARFKAKMNGYSPIFLVMFSEYFRRFGSVDTHIFDMDAEGIQGALVQHYLKVAHSVDTVLLWMIHGSYPFDVELIQELSGKPRDWCEARFHRLKELRFVITHPDNTLTVHDEMQRLLQKYVWDRAYPSRHGKSDKARILVVILQRYIKKHRQVQAEIAQLLAKARKAYVEILSYDESHDERSPIPAMAMSVLPTSTRQVQQSTDDWLEQERLELRERTLLMEMEWLADDLYAIDRDAYFRYQVEILERKWELFKRSYASDYQQEIITYMERTIKPNAIKIGLWDNPAVDPALFFKIRRRDIQLHLEAVGNYEAMVEAYDQLGAMIVASQQTGEREFERVRVQIESRKIEAQLRVVSLGSTLQEYEETLDKDVKVCEKYGFEQPRSEINIQLGTINMMQGDLAKAAVSYKNALEFLPGDATDPLRIQMELTDVLHSYGYALRHDSLQSSLFMCERTYELALQERRHFLAAKIQIELSELYRLKGDHQRARKAADRAHQYARGNVTTVNADGTSDAHIVHYDLPLLSLIQLGVSHWYLAEETGKDLDWQQAEQALREAVAQLEEKPMRGYQWTSELAHLHYILSRYSKRVSAHRIVSVYDEMRARIERGLELSRSIQNDYRVMNGLRNALQLEADTDPKMRYEAFCALDPYIEYQMMVSGWNEKIANDTGRNDNPYDTCAIYLAHIEMTAGEVAQRDPQRLNRALAHYQQALWYMLPRVRYKPTLMVEVVERLRGLLAQLKDDPERVVMWVESFQNFIAQEPKIASAYPSLGDFLICAQIRMRRSAGTATRLPLIDVTTKGALAHRLILQEDYQRAAAIIGDQLRHQEQEQHSLCEVEYALDEGYYGAPDQTVNAADLVDTLNAIKAWAMQHRLTEARWYVASARCAIIDTRVEDKTAALHLYQQAIEAAANLPDYYPWVCYYFGRTLRFFGLFDAAKRVLNRAIETALAQSSSVCMGNAAQELAILHSLTGNNATALEYADLSIALMEQRSHWRGLTRSYTARAIVRRGLVSYNRLQGASNTNLNPYESALRDLQSASMFAEQVNYSAWKCEIDKEYAITRSYAARDLLYGQPRQSGDLFEAARLNWVRALEQSEQLPLEYDRQIMQAKLHQVNALLLKLAQPSDQALKQREDIAAHLTDGCQLAAAQQHWALYVNLATDLIELNAVFDLLRYQFGGAPTKERLSPHTSAYSTLKHQDTHYQRFILFQERLNDVGKWLPEVLAAFGVSGERGGADESALAQHYQGKVELVLGTLAQAEGDEQSALQHYIRGVTLLVQGAYATYNIKRVIDMLDVRFAHLETPRLRRWWAAVMHERWNGVEKIRTHYPELLTFCYFQQLMGTYEFESAV